MFNAMQSKSCSYHVPLVGSHIIPYAGIEAVRAKPDHGPSPVTLDM